ncbi:MAG: HpcH/HpaI aldolase/citrate lyase family protein [Bacteroidota bacterium]
MNIRINQLKKQLLSGQKSYGIWHGIPNSYIAELCAGAGFDWVCIDGEHGPFDFNQVIQNLQAIQLHSSSAVVRVPTADPVIIKQVLELGAQNIVIPMIESAEQAELMVKAMLYPPEGIRGIGAGFARAAQWGRVDDYLHMANEQMCCICQVETVKGVEALDEMLKVEGLDVIFIGPADLAASMGYLGQAAHPEVVQLIIDCIKKIVKARKSAGFLTSHKPSIQAFIDAGAKMIGVGADATLFADATQQVLEKYKF